MQGNSSIGVRMDFQLLWRLVQIVVVWKPIEQDIRFYVKSIQGGLGQGTARL